MYTVAVFICLTSWYNDHHLDIKVELIPDHDRLSYDGDCSVVER
jgi:hypothetical protein